MSPKMYSLFPLTSQNNLASLQPPGPAILNVESMLTRAPIRLDQLSCGGVPVDVATQHVISTRARNATSFRVEGNHRGQTELGPNMCEFVGLLLVTMNFKTCETVSCGVGARRIGCNNQVQQLDGISAFRGRSVRRPARLRIDATRRCGAEQTLPRFRPRKTTPYKLES